MTVKCVLYRKGETVPGKEYLDGEVSALLGKIAEEAARTGVLVDVREYMAV